MLMKLPAPLVGEMVAVRVTVWPEAAGNNYYKDLQVAGVIRLSGPGPYLAGRWLLRTDRGPEPDSGPAGGRR